MVKYICLMLMGLAAVVGVALPSATHASGPTVTTITNRISTNPTGIESVCYGWAEGAGTVTTVGSGTIKEFNNKRVIDTAGTFTATEAAPGTRSFSGTYTARFTFMDGEKIQADVRAEFTGADGSHSFRVWGNNASEVLKPHIKCS